MIKEDDPEDLALEVLTLLQAAEADMQTVLSLLKRSSKKESERGKVIRFSRPVRKG